MGTDENTKWLKANPALLFQHDPTKKIEPMKCYFDDIKKKETVPETFDILLPRGNNNVVFKSGSMISVILYHGSNPVEVEAVINYLKTYKDKNEPVPLKNTDFKVIIDDVVILSSEDFPSMSTKYKVMLKGELTCCVEAES